MKATHTPGPWRYDTASRHGGMVVDANGKAVAQAMWRDDGWMARTYANADLIASAPDLLDALKGLRAVARATFSESPFEMRADEREALTAAEQAIARAEGRVA